MSANDRARADDLLDLLADEVAARLEARKSAGAVAPTVPSAPSLPSPVLPPSPRPLPPASDISPAPEQDTASEVALDEAVPLVATGASRLIRRLALGLLVIIVLINLPFNRHGTSLARALPGSAALVIRDGLVVKEADKDPIYVFRHEQFHWISSLEAFAHYGYRWQQVRIVEPGFMATFELGAPIHVLLKCQDSPHIYRLENDYKRWIVDIPAFEAEGHVWDDVRMVDCDYLRGIPDGETIPPGRGPAPQP